MLNLALCDYQFERTFARSVEEVPDVVRLAKISRQLALSIEYTDTNRNMLRYKADFTAARLLA